MTRQTATEIIERFNADPKAIGFDGIISVSHINGIVDALRTTDYGDGPPTEDELDQIRTALETVYLNA